MKPRQLALTLATVGLFTACAPAETQVPRTPTRIVIPAPTALPTPWPTNMPSPTNTPELPIVTPEALATPTHEVINDAEYAAYLRKLWSEHNVIMAETINPNMHVAYHVSYGSNMGPDTSTSEDAAEQLQKFSDGIGWSNYVRILTVGRPYVVVLGKDGCGYPLSDELVLPLPQGTMYEVADVWVRTNRKGELFLGQGLNIQTYEPILGLFITADPEEARVLMDLWLQLHHPSLVCAP